MDVAGGLALQHPGFAVRIVAVIGQGRAIEGFTYRIAGLGRLFVERLRLGVVRNQGAAAHGIGFAQLACRLGIAGGIGLLEPLDGQVAAFLVGLGIVEIAERQHGWRIAVTGRFFEPGDLRHLSGHVFGAGGSLEAQLILHFGVAHLGTGIVDQIIVSRLPVLGYGAETDDEDRHDHAGRDQQTLPVLIFFHRHPPVAIAQTYKIGLKKQAPSPTRFSSAAVRGETKSVDLWRASL